MKKALQITLNGVIFTIEEDAYVKLNDYLDSIRKYYGEKEGEEIISDIEASIADKLREKLNKTQEVITHTHVAEIVQIMGTVNDFDENKEAKDNPTEKTNEAEGKLEKPKRLYRNPEDSIIGGVCSGIAQYLGIDPVFVRLAFIIFTLINGIGILAYFIFWIIIPEAKTNSQKLEMQGKPVNLEKLEQVIREKSQMLKKESQEAVAKFSQKKPLLHKIFNFPIVLLRYVVIFCRKVFAVVFPIMRVVLGLGIIFAILLAIFSVSLVFTFFIFNIQSIHPEARDLFQIVASSSGYYIALAFGYFVILIPLIFSLLLGVTILRKKNSFNWIASSILLGFWIVAIIFSSAFGVDTYFKHKTAVDEYFKAHASIEENWDAECLQADFRVEVK